MKRTGIIITVISILMLVMGCKKESNQNETNEKEFIPLEGAEYCDGYCIRCLGRLGNDLESAWVALKEEYARNFPEWRLSKNKRSFDFKWEYDNRTFWIFDVYEGSRPVGDDIIDSKGFYYAFIRID